MIRLRPLGLETGRALIDFRGKSQAASAFADKQLVGAVALYNILAEKGFAYLADEVGMGKTYVALGVVALMRHFNPNMRVLYAAPRENIQRKWDKEIRNFTANNWKVADHRVKTTQGTPAVPVVFCDNLMDLIRGVQINVDRDFLVRLTSFSLPLHQKHGAKEKRAELFRLAPWLPSEPFDLRGEDLSGFKDAYGRAINALLPTFDLVIVDEAHNLRHGFGKNVSARNRILGLALGHHDDDAPRFEGCGLKAERVLVLSATPVEGSFSQLWAQMDLLGKGDVASELRRSDLEVEEGRRIARDFVVRRLTEIEVAGQPHTKNMYRREWRSGGVGEFDHPLEVPGDRQRLVVALIQKKVADVLAKRQNGSRGTRFGRSFQIGMLSSFESFLETAGVKDESGSNFADAEVVENQAEREGIDTRSVNKIARDYYREFEETLPHPKMDALSDELGRSMLEHGEKTLIFVRRVMSVPELADKVLRCYDEWLRKYLLANVNAGVARDVERMFSAYGAQRRQEGAHVSRADGAEDSGAIDSFFAWFFRGEGRNRRIFSGAAFRTNRLDSEGAAASTLFLDNHVKWLLGYPESVVVRMADLFGSTIDGESEDLRARAFQAFRAVRRAKDFRKRPVFLAYQEAALRRLTELHGPIGDKAAEVLRAAYSDAPAMATTPVPPNFPAADRLDEATLWTALVARPELRGTLWPEPAGSFAEAFRERETRREMMNAAIRLGHPAIDLWLEAVRNFDGLERGADDDLSGQELATRFLDRLESQRGLPGPTSYRELAHIAEHFHLILDVNFPELRDKPLPGVTRYLADTLGQQSPVAGMWGEVTPRTVKQFRMPGYPLVLVTTDVLREGEDLHTFCHRVVHYGITWTSSAMEQRTGRIDRIGSLTHRRLADSKEKLAEHLIQVLYPYLADTVELVQVQEVFRRMNAFIEMLHDRASDKRVEESSIQLDRRILNPAELVPQISSRLQSVFEIRPEWLPDLPARLAVREDELRKPQETFKAIRDAIGATFDVDWDRSDRCATNHHRGTAYLRGGEVLRRGRLRDGVRRKQPFTIELRTSVPGGWALVRFTSPVGDIRFDDDQVVGTLLETDRGLGCTKMCALRDDVRGVYQLSMQADMVITPGADQLASARDTFAAVVAVADRIEEEVLEKDQAWSDLEAPPEEEP